MILVFSKLESIALSFDGSLYFNLFNSIYVFPEMKLRGLVTSFYINVSVSDFYVFPGSVYLFGFSKIGRLILENMNRSQKHECGNWETTHYNSVLEITRPRSFISGNT